MPVLLLFITYLVLVLNHLLNLQVSSIPTEILTSPSVIPSLARISAGIDACVINAGTEIKLSTAPKLSANV